MFLRTLTTILLAVAVVATPVVAFSEPGDGLHSGNVTVSPALSLGASTNSNVFRLSPFERTPIAGVSLTFVPSLSISSIDPSVANVQVDARVGWRQYVGGNRFVRAQSGLTADAGASVRFNQQGAVSFGLQERFQRTNEPPYTPASFAYNRAVNRLGATLGVHPGGKVFQHYLSYDWGVVLHDELPDLNRQVHGITLTNHWRFLPKTAAVLVGDYEIVRYNQETRQGSFSNVNSSPLRISAGLSGLLTNRLSLRLLGGWGWAFYEDENSFSGLVVDTQLAYALAVEAEKNKIMLGYTRNFQDASIANYAAFHRIYSSYVQRIFSGRAGLSANASIMIRDYVGSPQGEFDAPGGTVEIRGNLSDLLFGIGGGVSFNIYKWWSVAAKYQYSANLTDDVVVNIGGPDSVRSYDQHVVSISTTFRY